MRSFGIVYLSASLLFVSGALCRADAVITFAKTQALTVDALSDAGPQAITLADVNKDNRADLLVVEGNSNRVDVFLNQGTGFDAMPTAIYDTGDSPVAVAVGDINSDGIVDLVTVNHGSNSVTVRLGTGDGVFAADAGQFDVDADPVGVVIADLDNDGVKDLAVLSDASVYLLKSQNNGSFSPFPTPSIQTGRRTGIASGGFAIAVGSLNGDAFPDLITSNHDTDNVSVLLGNGNGTFQAPVVRQVGDAPNGIAIGDLNGDAFQDVAVVLERSGAESDRNVQLLFGKGDGTFDPDDIRTTAADSDMAIAVVDLDGDGKSDMAVVNVSGGLGLVVLCNSGGACFSTSTTANPPENGFQQQLIAGAGNTVVVQVGAIDSDVLPDLALLAEDGSEVDVLLNTTGQPTPVRTSGGSPTLTPAATATPNGPTETPTPTATPVPTATPTPLPAAYGVCNTKESSQPTIGGRPVAVAVGDFNHDGQPDIAVADNSGNRIVILKSHIMPTGATACEVLGLSQGAEITGVTAPVALIAQDLDADGKLDLAVVGTNGLSVFFGKGDGTFTPAPNNPMVAGNGAGSLAAADFNRDGLLDLIVANEQSNDVSIFLGAPNHSFQPACNLSVNRHATLVATQDLNRDGRRDFLVASDETDELSVFLQLSTTPTSNSLACSMTAPTFGFRALGTLDAGATPESLVIDQFQPNDSIPDIAVATSSTNGGQVQILFGQTSGGDVVYARRQPLTVPTPTNSSKASIPSALASGDIDRDGRADLVVADRNNDDVVIFFAGNDGSFTNNSISFRVNGVGPAALAVSDIDGDGKPDIVVANAGDGSVSILVSSRPPPTPTPPPTPSPTITGTPTPTGTVTPTSATPPTVTFAPTRTRAPTLTPTQTPIDTPRGVITLGGSCAVDDSAGRPSGWLLLPLGVALIFRATRHCGTRPMNGHIE